MPEAARISVRNLSVQLQGRDILHTLSFDIEAGACVGILGPNGSGKTTLLQSILGFLPWARGRILFDDIDLSSMSAQEKSRTLAYVAQDASSSLSLTVDSFLELAYFPWRGHLRWEDWEQDLQRLLGEFNLTDKRQRKLGTLSGGERQRVILVQSLLQRPKILLLDEITNHLDIFYQLETLQYLCRKPMTKVMVLHDINLAARYCDHVIMLKDGRCVFAGPTDQVLREEMIQEVYGVPCEIVRREGRIHYIALGATDQSLK
jgi:iron complex transport system ATP-binding protein